MTARRAAATRSIGVSFIGDETMQALLLSAQRDASGLTLTAASHVIICEPQPDVAVEQQMVGRVHRIGQTRQTHIHHVVVSGTFEAQVAVARLGASTVCAADRAGNVDGCREGSTIEDCSD